SQQVTIMTRKLQHIRRLPDRCPSGSAGARAGLPMPRAVLVLPPAPGGADRGRGPRDPDSSCPDLALSSTVLAIEDPLPLPARAVPPGAATEPSPQRLRSLARAAQQDILRRLTPPLRHDMVVHLQSLGMMAEALGARLERGAVAAEDLQSSVSKLNRLSRQAVARCLEVCTWMEPGEDDTIALRE